MNESNHSQLSIIAWNINGYRPEIHKSLKNNIIDLQSPDSKGIDVPQKRNVDIVFLSETKKKKIDLQPLFSEFIDYDAVISSHQPSNFHGVAMLIKKNIDYEIINFAMDIPCRKDSQAPDATIGRVICIKVSNSIDKEIPTYIVGTYTPNSGQKDKIKLDYRIDIWDKAFYNYMNELEKEAHVIWIGDINVAENEIDVSNPSYMKYYAGFTPEERKSFKKFKDDKSTHSTSNKSTHSNRWIDIWRHTNPEEILYTWRGKTGSGMRLDNIIVSESLLSICKFDPFYLDFKHSSDHIPIGVTIKC